MIRFRYIRTNRVGLGSPALLMCLSALLVPESVRINWIWNIITSLYFEQLSANLGTNESEISPNNRVVIVQYVCFTQSIK